MFRAALLILGIATLTGCSSTPKVVAERPQYCHTSQEIIVKDGKEVNSLTKRLFHSKSGMSPNCVKFDYEMQMGGYYVQRQGVSCQKPDGSWEIVNTGTGY